MASAMRLRVSWLSLSIGIFLQTYSSAAVMLAMVFWSNSVSTVLLYKNGFKECQSLRPRDSRADHNRCEDADEYAFVALKREMRDILRRPSDQELASMSDEVRIGSLRL